MDKLVIGLLDGDAEYVRLFASYLRSSAYRDKCLLKVFTKPENVPAQRNAGERMMDLLLASPEHAAELRHSGFPVPIVLLGWTEEAAGMNIDGQPARTVEKYQPLNMLLENLWKIAEDMGVGPARGEAPLSGQSQGTDGEGRIVAFYSAIGGCGKTTITANLARLLAYRGHRVQYVSLEGLPSSPVFPREEDNAMERLLYLVKFGPDTLTGKIGRVKHHDPRTKVDYLLPPDHLSELDGITEQDMSVWLGALRQSDEYDFILLDLDATTHPRILGAIRYCHELVWVITDDVHCLSKTRHLLAELSGSAGMEAVQLKRKTSFLLNKYVGSTANDLEDAGLHPSGQLPYVPAWKGVADVEALFADSGFQEQLVRWFCHEHGVGQRQDHEKAGGGVMVAR